MIRWFKDFWSALLFGLLVMACVIGIIVSIRREQARCDSLFTRAQTFQDTLQVAKVSEHCLLMIRP